MKLTKPVNYRPVQEGDIVRVWGFTHEPGLYLVRSIGTTMTVISPLDEDDWPANFGQGVDYDNLILAAQEIL